MTRLDRPTPRAGSLLAIVATGIPVLLFVAALLAPAGAAWALPVPENCQPDPRGANDEPGQRDLTKFCVDRGDGSPFELHTIVNVDDITVTGANTIDSCALYNTDDDAFVNLAVCVTLTSSGPDDGNLTRFGNVRLFSCKDTKADRCMGSVLLPGPYRTACEVSHTDDDPFSPAAPNGPGGDYPWDTRILCAIDLDDFGVASPVTRLVDGCSYPSTVPNSDPEECILFQNCASDRACDDGNECSVDTCDPSGVCVHLPGPAAACSDGLFCDGDETCNSLGFCGTSSSPRNCDDGVDCTLDSCDEFGDGCVNDPRSSTCDDGLFCNGAEACDAVAGCVAGEPANCDDNVACTADSCDEAGDSCLHSASAAACDDGAFCNGVESCDPAAGCQPGTAPDCADDVGCTLDSCDESSDSCTNLENDAACDNGRFCDGGERCDAAAGCVAASAPACDDGVECTSDRCDDGLNSCVNEPDNAPCSDGNFCNGVEICDPVAGCTGGEDPCNGGACAGTCLGCTSDALCDNGVFCDGAETCNTVTGTCSPGRPVDCNDAVGCTVDSCDEAAGACTHAAVDAACDNGLFCDGREACDPAAGCVAGPVSGCDDGVACTVDTCVEATDTCGHAPSDGLCDNGLYCDGTETCDTRHGCQAGEDVICRPDKFQCSRERCDESTDSCASDFSYCVCGDREIVGQEECEPPQRAGTFEDCNNLIDDDRDGLLDCADPECSPESRRAWVCDENCRRDVACAAVANDPAVIVFRQGRGPDSLWMHGRFPLDGPVDPTAEAFSIRVDNEVEPVFVAALEAGSLRRNGAFFSFVDPEAPVLGNRSRSGGLASVRLRLRSVDGVPNLTFRIQAWGDFSAATRRVMTSQIAVGSESGTLTAEWKAKPRKWLLHQKEF